MIALSELIGRLGALMSGWKTYAAALALAGAGWQAAVAGDGTQALALFGQALAAAGLRHALSKAAPTPVEPQEPTVI